MIICDSNRDCDRSRGPNIGHNPCCADGVTCRLKVLESEDARKRLLKDVLDAMYLDQVVDDKEFSVDKPNEDGTCDTDKRCVHWRFANDQERNTRATGGTGTAA